jgi:type VI protein secretion system component Hcp
LRGCSCTASDALLNATVEGTQLSSAKLELFSSAGGTGVAHTYDLANVLVSSFEDEATAETGITPVREQITLRAGRYKQTDGGATACWDAARGVAC